MDFGPSIPPPENEKKKRRLNAIPIEFLQNLPSGAMYEKSYMHRDCVSHVLQCSTSESDFFVSASRDGHVKFWKKRAKGVEFAKHFRAHVGVIVGMDCSKCGTRVVTLGEGLRREQFRHDWNDTVEKERG